MSAVLGSAGSTIAEELSLDVIPEFVFKDDIESGNFLTILERRSLAWQPSSIPPQLQELILADLEKNRSLAEARSILISVITYLHSNSEPLIINKARKNFLSDVLEDLLQAEILTERHVSNATLGVLNRHLRLEVRHIFGLLKAIMSRMKGDDIFGGRIPEGWTTMLPERLGQLTSQRLLTNAEPGGILETLLQHVNVVSASNPAPVDLMPEKSLLYAIRQIEGSEWDGISAEIKMENIGHVLLIVESLVNK